MVRKERREMGVELLEIGVQIRKFVIFSIRTCYRSVCNHPFLVGMVFVLFFLYRSFPFLFSLLVSASPILVCTAILLGTLLSFGQPNIPEIEREEKTTHEIVSLKTGIQRDSTVVERNDSSVVESYTTKRRDVVEKSIEEPNSTADVVSEVDKSDGSLVYSAPLIEENSREIQLEKREIEEAERELHDSGLKMKTEMNEEKLGDGVFLENQYSRIAKAEDEDVELQHDKSPVESVDSRMTDHADSSPGSPWKRVDEEEEEVDDEASTGSDQAESSSPDASMADIIPMLDELHPLLDEDAPQPAHMSHDASDAGSERSQKSSDGNNESDEDSEIQEEEVGDDGNDDDEEEEETQGGTEDATKSAITWTEDDQKNLMDLGTLELERNQRLESLIARRRARRMMTEKNLIDLESADLPFNVPPISTARRNPFDLPYGSNDNTGLPPIPGSAPSILLPRRNPFDLPYDSSEEKPNLMGDSFQQEFTPFHPKEMFFRRHESFNVGPSFFGPPKKEKHDIKLKPYFVPERVASEETSISSFQRQSSELSDSKVSSVPETESICSVGDQDDNKLIEEDFSQEGELISDVDHPSEHVGHGSESSEDLDAVELGQPENRGFEHDEVEIKLGDVESHHEILSSFSETRDVATPREQDTGEIHLNARVDEVNYSSRSSSSSLSEVHERIFEDIEEKVSSSLEPEKENVIEESGMSIQPSLEESGFNITIGLVDNSQHKEPVYDSSPPAVQNSLSSSSISSDLQVETPEMGFSPVLVRRTVSFADRESELSNQSMEMDTPGNELILVDSSQVHPGDKNELTTSGFPEKAEHILLNQELSGDDQKLDGANASIVPEFGADHAAISLTSSSNPGAVADHLMFQDRSYQHEQDQVPSSSLGTDIYVAVHQVLGEGMVSAASSSEYRSSEDLPLTASKEEQHSVVFEQVSGNHPIASSSENESIAEHPLDKDVALQTKQHQVHSSNCDANFHVGIDQEANEELLSTHSECVSEEKRMYELEEQQPLSDKAMVELSSENHEELVEPSIIQAESIEEVSSTSNLDASKVQLENKVSSDIYSPLSPDPTSFLSEVSETRSPRGLADTKDNALDGIENPDHIPVQPFNFPTEATGPQVHEQDIIEEADEIKEIDEGLLMELDTVGDFSVKEFGSNLIEIENNQIPEGEMNSDLPLIEAQSVEDIDFILKKNEPEPMKTEVEIGEFEIPHLGQIKEEINSGMPVLEARSLEDIDTAFRKISEEEIEKPAVVESLHAELEKEETETGCSEYGICHKDSSLTETKMELPVVEARSIEDIDLALKQLHDVERHSSPSSVHDRPVVVESEDPAETYPDLHVERQSKPISVDDRANVVESEDPADTNSDLHVSETRSLEDADMAPKLASEGNVDKLLKSDFKDGSAESDSNEVGSSKEIESTTRELGVPETSTSTAEQPGHGAQTSDSLSLSMSDGKGKKEKSHKLTTSSSSSSSSSSSDSE